MEMEEPPTVAHLIDLYVGLDICHRPSRQKKESTVCVTGTHKEDIYTNSPHECI